MGALASHTKSVSSRFPRGSHGRMRTKPAFLSVRSRLECSLQVPVSNDQHTHITISRMFCLPFFCASAFSCKKAKSLLRLQLCGGGRRRMRSGRTRARQRGAGLRQQKGQRPPRNPAHPQRRARGPERPDSGGTGGSKAGGVGPAPGGLGFLLRQSKRYVR